MTANRVSIFIIVFLHLMTTCVNSYNFPMINLKSPMRRPVLHYVRPIQMLPAVTDKTLCLMDNKITDCSVFLKITTFRNIPRNNIRLSRYNHQGRKCAVAVLSKLKQTSNFNIRHPYSGRRILHVKQPYDLRNRFTFNYKHQTTPYYTKNNNVYDHVRKPEHNLGVTDIQKLELRNFKSNITRTASNLTKSTVMNEGANQTTENEVTKTDVLSTTPIDRLSSGTTEILSKEESSERTNHFAFKSFIESLSEFERNFYKVTFEKLLSITPPNRRENGISFVMSGLFIHMLLMTLSVNADYDTRKEIEECLQYNASTTEKTEAIKRVISMLPLSSTDLKFRWTSRLVMGGANVSDEFRSGPAAALQLQLDHINQTQTAEVLARTLNKMVEVDSKGAMRDTFDEDELSDGVRTVLLNTVYVRARWRSAPTLLNGTRPFRDADDAPKRTTRMIRINDLMRYADLKDWDAEAIEIAYSTPGLSLLLLVPRALSLRSLMANVATTDLASITDRMATKRLAVSLPLYTLRMTLILPSKLQAIGVTRLVNVGVNSTNNEELRLSHAVQRIMFWSEAGRQAFKDDGIEWDEVPELEFLLDRPYLFYVRWHNITLVNGNFVL